MWLPGVNRGSRPPVGWISAKSLVVVLTSQTPATFTVMIWRLSSPSCWSDMPASFSAVAACLTTLSSGAVAATLAGRRSRTTGSLSNPRRPICLVS